MSDFLRGVQTERERIRGIIAELIANEERLGQDNAFAVLGTIRDAIKEDAVFPVIQENRGVYPSQIKPWEGRPDEYGPSIEGWIYNLAWEVLREEGRLLIKEIMRKKGRTETLRGMMPERYDRFMHACYKELNRG